MLLRYVHVRVPIHWHLNIASLVSLFPPEKEVTGAIPELQSCSFAFVRTTHNLYISVLRIIRCKPKAQNQQFHARKAAASARHDLVVGIQIETPPEGPFFGELLFCSSQQRTTSPSAYAAQRGSNEQA